MQAIRDDSAAFGLGSLAGALLLMVIIAIAVDILNRVALNQVCMGKCSMLMSFTLYVHSDSDLDRPHTKGLSGINIETGHVVVRHHIRK